MARSNPPTEQSTIPTAGLPINSEVAAIAKAAADRAGAVDVRGTSGTGYCDKG